MWLIDTNVLSEARKPKPEPQVLAFLNGRPLSQLYISVVTLAEIRFGIDSIEDPTRRAALAAWLTETIRPMFDQRVLPITEAIMLRWRTLLEAGRKTGHTYSQPDLIIAATALEHGLEVVTRDRSEYDRAGVRVVNPWE